MEEGFLLLKDLHVYKLAVSLSRDCWIIFDRMDWHDKKIMGGGSIYYCRRFYRR